MNFRWDLNNLESKWSSNDNDSLLMIDQTKVLLNKWQRYKIYTIEYGLEYTDYRTLTESNRWDVVWKDLYAKSKSNLISVMFNWFNVHELCVAFVHSGTMVQQFQCNSRGLCALFIHISVHRTDKIGSKFEWTMNV